ncbi:complex I assembly factor ACAD9, mitochondrial-like isoform X2 [Uloborus diversus]|uniref:complex I assembly factor ACAD9, mitochondrial-like isoform X2 n=1 Tax=Uloborus diversus TaxID=327109 RepID=UPI00240A5F51|nr:complex I assembly factor ACAD9, mitochondrial-like isoform X2 [Uloborus diversus]
MDVGKIFFSTLRQSRISSYGSRLRGSLGVNFVKNCAAQHSRAEEAVVGREKIQLSRPSVVKWKRPPFMKCLFVNKYDVELCAFPEILTKEQLAEVEDSVKSINLLYAEKVNSHEIDETQTIPDSILQDLRELGLFGRMIPTKYGGLDLTHTACTRINEVLGLDWSLYASITAHEFMATQMLLLYGSEEQKQKYLPLLASGKKIAAFCCSEFKSGNDLLSISTTADNVPEGFRLSGTKSWVTNAENADLFIVFAKMQGHMDPKSREISVLVVERDSEGIEVVPLEKTCLRGCKTGVVTFKEVLVPSGNIIGTLGRGYEMYLKVMENFRFMLNSFTFGTLKLLLDSVTEHVIHTERLGKSLADVQLVRTKLTKISSVIYAMESVSYFTAAICDSTENPDIALEMAAMKVFNSENTLYCLRELMDVVGSSSFTKRLQLERLYRDAQGLAMFDGSNDIARLYIGLSGCKFVGSEKAQEVLKFRNRFFFPTDHFKDIIRRMRIKMNRARFEHDIAGHVHPSLVIPANNLESRLQRFELAVEEVLSDHGAKVVETQIEPKKLANAAIEFYVQAAVLARISRSYCIGLKNTTHEMLLASIFCHDSDLRIVLELNDILVGMAKNSEGPALLLSEQVIDTKGYFPEHPLRHNY